MDILNLNTGFCYPYDLMTNLPVFPPQHAIPCQAFAIEIHLVFEQDRILKIHLNPAVPQTIEFLKLCSETRMISFHYYNESKKFFASSITGLKDDHVDWFKRNWEKKLWN